MREKLRHMLHQQSARLDQLLQTPSVLRGSCSRVFTRCGKPNCWCAQSAKGHPHARITWSENGKLITRKVPAEQLEHVRRLTANYRQFRATRRQLTAAQTRLRSLLDRYEMVLVAQARKPMKFLALNPEMSRGQGTKLQKTRKARKDYER